jgi:iron complex transport system ATP-binding protein
LLATVSGELWPSRGIIRVLGAEYGRVDKRELKKRIGVVSSALFTNLPNDDTGLEIAASGIRAMIGKWGAPDPAELARGARVLERVGASSTANKPYGVLSQGEKQRVMIARALVNEPDLLILDEPCNGLDPAARERILVDLGALARDPSGPTQIHVTHHLEEVPSFVTHALVLAEGRVLACGEVGSVLTAATLTRAFGSVCRVDVEKSGGERRFRLWVDHPGST